MRRLLGLTGFILLASALDAFAMPPGLTEGCKAVYRRYEAADGPKAFAAGKTTACGWQKKIEERAETMDQIRRLALFQCETNGGDNCRIVHTGR